MTSKRDHERDAELDKKIEALRRKNEVLMKRYKEVEEDKKRAEEEGMALQSRKGKADDLTITISKSTSDSRVVVSKPISVSSPAEEGQREAGADRAKESSSRGHRKQLTVTMAGKKGKRVVSEKPDKKPVSADIKGPTDDGPGRSVESPGRGKQPPHANKRDPLVQDQAQQGPEHNEEHHRLSTPSQEPASQQASTDLNIPTSKEEQEEYIRWKKEREQIDRERVARHKNAKGQWRRAWDMDKTENMFSDRALPDRDWGASSRGGRNSRRGQSRADSRGQEKRGKEKKAKNVPATSSKAKGIDRLTGRARRWEENEVGDNLQMSDTTLEEFLEELDALTDAVAEECKDRDSAVNASTTLLSPSTSEDATPSAGLATAEDSSPRTSEKRVRFSEESLPLAHTRPTAPSQDSAHSESASPTSLNASLPPLEASKCVQQDQGGCPPALLVAEQQSSESECTKTDSSPSGASSPPSAHREPHSVHPAELSKCNSTNAEESGLSVLSLEVGETHPAHPTSSDKAREQGKIV
ncbi:coiled-coil domain-containing protein 9B isoform X1 [Takifugu flavidus]|uniref:coiled-coil domain-containing protein 9B isoform X1 n=1 Tax=Takifugu flavidus TaxID=433684 RepID=UPI0025441217|nr:coiled-coil domain-containing protein 9B isoform X1 [Takifugu flavidus]XP_056867993.1 coiled-coil domain-containing protein 9B isoform X1 [Takifugu flavidus]